MKNKNLLLIFWLFTLAVILWGAWVRISHSGNGCGDHWPLCDGQFIPTATDSKTWIEFSHRLMSGLYGFIVIYLFIKYRAQKYSQNTRALATALFIFMLIEAAVGALLVKQSLVTVNDSIYRLVVMSLHQINSFLLTGATLLLVLSLTQNIRLKWTRIHTIFLIVCTTGAIAALATTLFPSESLLDGIAKDLTGDSHLFLKLRILHPILALSLMGTLTYWLLDRGHKRLAIETFIAICVGVLTLMTLSPTWLKIAHLLLAHCLWARYLSFLSIDSTQKV